jgi:L-ascorbate metabolism protein UlaG (beta-lactamase superfamily)
MLRINLRSGIITSILVFAVLCTSTSGKTIYVDNDATGANDGTSWENAYTFLQEALADANSAEKPVEIRVAQGIYKPDMGANQTPGDREATFKLINGVTIKGGYAGVGELDPNARDIELYKTILSGDLDGNDSDDNNPFDATRDENCYHVLTAVEADKTAVLNGLTIMNGNGFQNMWEDSKDGAGMLIENSCPSLICCTFNSNAGRYGGAMYNLRSNPILTDCKFTGNVSPDGGGIYNDDQSNPNLINCIFTWNFSGIGGGMSNFQSCPILADCIFKANISNLDGGGMSNEKQSCPTLTNCKFTGNKSGYGGGISNWENCSPSLTNCTFSGNLATIWGGGMYNILNGNPILTNCTFIGNSSDRTGDGIFNYESNTILTNCILRNGGNEIWNDDNSMIMITYSNIQGGWPGLGNIDEDPLFAKPGYWIDINDPNSVAEPNDPNAVWIDGDYHLKSEAGRWDLVGESWVVDDVTSPCIDAGDPNSPVGDEPEPNGGIINMGAYGGTAEASMSPVAEQIVYVQWLGHSTVKAWTEDCIVYVDPERVPESLHDATLVCVTHTHGDHYSPSDIAKVSNAETQFIAPPDVVQRYGSGLTIAPGQTIEFDFVTIKAVPAYNINKSNHPKSNNWVGYIIELAGKRIYVAGDTDMIEEMKSLGDINVAFLPAGGTYTMNATEAAEATGYVKPDLAIPYHWGQSVGTLGDAQRFAELAQCPAMVLTVGETISSDNWPEYSPLIAHWALDEAEGDIAHDSAGENHGTLYGEPSWRPDDGKIDGALLLDGIDDYISTNFVQDPARGPFSVFAWIKDGAAGQAIISQANGAGSGETWLSTDPLLGKLMTGLVPPPAGRFIPQPLVSESIITDGQWHHIGFVWDGSYRILYADGTEVARDTAAQNPLKSADGGIYIGAGKNFDASAFFSGLIDNVQIYNTALSAEEIGALAE